MFLRLIIFCILYLSSVPLAQAETINLRNKCELWKHIPANNIPELPVTAHIKSTPITALLSCSDEANTWTALKIMCFQETAEIEYRYKSSYESSAPIPFDLQDDINAAENDIIHNADSVENILLSDETPQNNTDISSIKRREMLAFDFRRVGITHVVSYDFEASEWRHRVKEHRAQLFQRMIHGNYTDVTILTSGKTERLPLRGSTKALRPVIETCRKARIELDKKAAKLIQD